MDCPTYFWRKLMAMKENPRGMGYKNHIALINKLIEKKLWQTMTKRKLMLEELKLFCEVFDVAESTVRSWNKNLLINPNWLPNHERRTTSFNLTTHEENVLAEILRQIIDSELTNVTNTLVRTIALKYYYSRHSPNHKNQVHFCDKWIRQFKSRHNFSRRKVHKKRRPTASQQTIDEFINLIEEVFNTVPFSHIFNVDETFWRLCQSGDYTWAPTGSTNVTINTQDEKAGFTTVCTIGANGEKYQPILISIGTTEQCERN